MLLFAQQESDTVDFVVGFDWLELAVAANNTDAIGFFEYAVIRGENNALQQAYLAYSPHNNWPKLQACIEQSKNNMRLGMQ